MNLPRLVCPTLYSFYEFNAERALNSQEEYVGMPWRLSVDSAPISATEFSLGPPRDTLATHILVNS